MDSDLLQKIMHQGAWVDLSSLAKWRLSGADRVRYLNGQVTNDVRSANSTSALHACVTNAKGRMEGDVFIHAADDSLWLDAAPDLREPLGMRLERYIISDDAVLEDVSDAWQLWHRLSPAGVSDMPGGCPPEVRGLAAERFGRHGRDFWLPTSMPPDLLLTDGCPVLSAADAETLRILQRVPAWPSEINADRFPQEAGLEKSCMSFTKGCYIGQEVLSRIKTTGKMPHELIAWEKDGDTTAVRASSKLWLGEREVGHITSAALHPSTQRWVGLAYVRQGAVALDSVLRLGDALPSVDPQIKISAFLNQ